MYPILILLSLILTGVCYWFYKHPRKSQGSGGYQELDGVVSLDDDSPRSQRFQQDAPSPVGFLFFLVLTNVLILAFILFGGEKDVHDEDITFEELAVNQMGKILTTKLQKDKIEAILIVPSDTQRMQVYNSMVKSLKKGHGYRIEIVGEELTRTQAVSRMTLPGYSNQYITARDLNHIVSQYPGIEMVISLAGLLGNSEDIARESFPRKLFFAVFAEQGRLYDYVDLVHNGIVNLAVVSKGAYEYNSLVPKHIALDELMKQHFIVIMPENAAKIAADHRQYIGIYPIENDPIFGK